MLSDLPFSRIDTSISTQVKNSSRRQQLIGLWNLVKYATSSRNIKNTDYGYLQRNPNKPHEVRIFEYDLANFQISDNC